MNKEISFIVEFDEVNDNQLNKFNEFLEDTMIKFRILKSDNEIKENTNLKQALNEIREKLKYYKNDLDFEPWSIYPITGETLFDILQIIDKAIGDDK